MASIRNRNGVWQARILRKGQPAVSKSFQTRQDAERWARHIETQIDKGSYTSVALAENTTFAEVVERYIADGQPVGSASPFVLKGRYTHLVYAHGPDGLLAVSHCAPLPHALDWPYDAELTIANISADQPESMLRT